MPTEPARHRRAWTQEEDDQLQFYWGVFSIKTLATRLSRTEWGVAQRARILGLGPASRGEDSVTMRELERMSGFSVTKIMHVAKVLGMKLHRMQTSDPAHHSPIRPFAVTEEQAVVLIKHMLEHPLTYANRPGAGKTTKGVWGIGRKPPACLVCATTTRPHFAKGKCRSCYNAEFKRKKRAATPSGSS